MRVGQWNRLLERRVAAKEMAITDGWCQVIKASAFQGFGASGPFSRWWEDNAWYPLSELKSGRAAGPEEPAPLHVEASLGGLPASSGQQVVSQ